MLRRVEKSSQKPEHLPYSIAIVTSSYHHVLTKSMEAACREELIKLGVHEKNIHIYDAPG